MKTQQVHQIVSSITRDVNQGSESGNLLLLLKSKFKAVAKVEISILAVLFSSIY